MSEEQKIYRLLFILMSTFCLIPLGNAELLTILILFQLESYLCREKLSELALLTMIFLVITSATNTGIIPALLEVVLIFLIIRRL